MTQDHMKHRRGVYASPRQPQGDFGRGSDHAQLGSSDDVNRELNQRGAYRDAEPAQDPATGSRPSTPGRPSKAQPRRAEPLQPDRPGRGNGREKSDGDPTHDEEESVRRIATQSKDALDNVRDGYDR
jgi:hypothetical protein